MPDELIKCSRAVRTKAWNNSRHDVSMGMVKDDFAAFILLRRWSAGGQLRLIPH